MPQPLTLSIPQPCSESWAAMTPAAQGRHCAACAKVVIDFTALSDAEVVALLQRTAAPCGRFREDQLQRVLRPLAGPAPRWRTWLAAAAAVIGLRESLPAPAVAQRPTSLATQPLAPRQLTLKPLPITEIYGRVRHTGLRPVGGLQVQVLGTATMAYTTSDGHFLLTVPPQAADDGSIVLTISAPGYKSYQIAVLLDGVLPLDVELQPLQPDEPIRMVLGGIALTDVTVEKRPIRAIDLENAVRMATSRNP